MTQKQTGYLVLVAALGMLFVSMSPDIKTLNTWNDFWSPAFIGIMMGHVGSVIGAYIGGRITPISREGNERTRSTDK